MKIHRILFTAFVFVLSFTVQAQGLSENQRLLGYVQTDSITVSGGAFGAAGTYTIGAILTPQKLAAYAGCRVVGIRLAAALNLGRTRNFVYQVEGNKLTPAIEQNQRIYEGWNNVFFNGNGYEIQGNETLFYGFDYTETAEMVAADEGGLCGYGEDTDGGFYAYGNFGQGTGLYQLSNLGCLCVQLIVDVSSLPAHDIDITWFDAGFKYKKPGEKVDAMINFSNVGRNSISSYRLGYQLDDMDPVHETQTQSLVSGKMSLWQFSTKLPTDIANGMHTLKVFVDQVEGEPLAERSKNDTLSTSFAIYRNSYNRDKVLMEIYTDQNSLYAPYLNDAVKLLTKNNNNLTVVNVHRPDTPLGLSSAAYLHDLYAYTTPSFTFNRSYFPGEAYVAYDMNDYLPVIPAEMSANILSDMLMQDATTPSFATIGLQMSYDAATRSLRVKANGDVLPEAQAIYGDLALTLMLVEDGIKSPQVVYNSSIQRTKVNQDYLHDHVLRTYLTSPIGDLVPATNNQYEMSYDATLDANWNADKITVVALLTKKVDAVTDNNILDMDIINTSTLTMSEATGIVSLSIEARPSSNTIYTLDGRPVGGVLKPGIYIKDGKKIFIKNHIN